MPSVTAAATGRPAYSLSDDLVGPAETRDVTYRCPSGHTFVTRFFAARRGSPAPVGVPELRCPCAHRRPRIPV